MHKRWQLDAACSSFSGWRVLRWRQLLSTAVLFGGHTPQCWSYTIRERIWQLALETSLSHRRSERNLRWTLDHYARVQHVPPGTSLAVKKDTNRLPVSYAFDGVRALATTCTSWEPGEETLSVCRHTIQALRATLTPTPTKTCFKKCTQLYLISCLV